ncbi:NIN-like protein [Artemisia annua]|uniref:NIN-like protein n=1 Tax=Artemisia annua TaxID=35608 RepID=A0A2U1LT59_ARTAN|nr:NIN-like protein [Artemisia annua]
MDLCPHIQSVDSSDESKTSGFASDSDMKLALDISTPVVPSESRYLTRLMVYGNKDELSRSEWSQSTTTNGFELRTDNIDPHNKIIQDKIRAALKLLTFREQHVLVQFWSPRVAGKHQLLTSIDQPFGLGVLDERLLLYRKDSVHSSFVVDMNDEDEDSSPIARVFRRGLPEWTSDVTNYLPKDFPQQECAIRCNLNGYLALPVFDSDTRSCVGVIELFTSSKYSSFAYEVQQVESALKTTKLTTAQAFDSPNINVHYEQRQNELQRILSILKAVCETHQLPLAQTWAVSPPSGFASHEEILKMTYLGLWSFRKACREQHVDKACGLVGRALLSCGSCFCGNVTKLSEEEYPLVHNAQMSGDDGKHVHNLVQTLKENIEIAYGFELGDTSSIQVVGPPTEASLFLYTDPQRTINSCITTAKTNILETVSSDSESFVGDVAKTNSTYIVNQLPSKQELFNNNGATMITSTEILSLDDIERDNVNVACKKDNDNVMYDHDVSMHMTNVGEKSNSLKQGSKRKLYSLTMEAAEKHVGKPTDEAANSLGGKSSYLQRTSIEQFGLSSVVFLLLRIKRWSCLSKHHEFSGKWWLCGKHSYLPFKLDSVYQVAQVLLSLKRWRNRKSSMHAIHNRDHPTVFESIENPKYKPNIIKPYCYVNWKLAESSLVYASPKHTVASVISDAKKSKRLFLKYRDEDDDLILLACDADLRSLLRSSTSNNSVIKLIIALADDVESETIRLSYDGRFKSSLTRGDWDPKVAAL